MEHIEGVDQIAQTQHGVVHWDQLRASGMAPSSIVRLVEAGFLVRLHPRVYRLAGAAPTWHRDLMAATLAGGSEAVASHRAAATLWGIADPTGEVEISVPRHQSLGVRGAVVHRHA